MVVGYQHFRKHPYTFSAGALPAKHIFEAPNFSIDKGSIRRTVDQKAPGNFNFGKPTLGQVYLPYLGSETIGFPLIRPYQPLGVVISVG